MFETSLDAWYAWLGVALTSVAVYGVVAGFPVAAPPTATPAADTVDRVASSPHEARGTVAIEADDVKIDPHRIALQSDGATAHASFAYGPVTPVDSDRLERVLDGTPPADVFASEVAFADALARAQARSGTWRPAPAELTVRRVIWGETDATLVG